MKVLILASSLLRAEAAKREILKVTREQGFIVSQEDFVFGNMKNCRKVRIFIIPAELDLYAGSPSKRTKEMLNKSLTFPVEIVQDLPVEPSKNA